ncbi:tqsA [Symbiodinium sp. CCMP2456]|nr:tqsA [Symbiodinium sp. CCMP2456]
MHIEIPTVGPRFAREASPALSAHSEARSHLSSAVEVLLDAAVGRDDDRSGAMGLLSGEPSARTTRSRFRDVLGIGVVLITFFVGVWFLFWMRRVLVPLTFALFLAFLCEPLLAFMVTAPRYAARKMQRCKEHRSGDRKQHDRKGVPVGRAEEDVNSSDLDSTGSAASMTVSDCDGQAAKTCCTSCSKWLQQIWSFFAVLILVVTLLAVTFLIFYGVVRVFADFDWSQFRDSAKMRDMQSLLEKAGIVDRKMNVNFQKVAAEFRSYLLDTASTFFHFVEGYLNHFLRASDVHLLAPNMDSDMEMDAALNFLVSAPLFLEQLGLGKLSRGIFFQVDAQQLELRPTVCSRSADVREPATGKSSPAKTVVNFRAFYKPLTTWIICSRMLGTVTAEREDLVCSTQTLKDAPPLRVKGFLKKMCWWLGRRASHTVP